MNTGLRIVTYVCWQVTIEVTWDLTIWQEVIGVTEVSASLRSEDNTWDYGDLYSDLCSDLYSDLYWKEVTIGKAHKHWDERPISDLRRYIAKIIKKTTRTTREQLKKVSLANLLNCFLYHFGRFAKIPKLNCPKLSRLSLYIKVMLLEIEVMLLVAEGLPLHAEA